MVLNAIYTLRHIIEFYTPLPIWDYWQVVEHLPEYQSLKWGVLWRQHNENRIVFPEIVFAMDMLYAHGQMLLPLVLSSLSYLGTWTVLSLAAISDVRFPRWHCAIAVLLSGVVAFFETATMVLAVPFLLSWTFAQLGAAVSLFFLSTMKEKPSARSRYGVIAAATFATFSCANGLLLWPLLVSAAVLLRLGSRAVLTLIGAAMLNILLYFADYRLPVGHLAVGRLAAAPLQTLSFVASYMSMPFGIVKAPIFGVIVGSISLVLAVCLFLLAWKSKLIASKPAIVLFGYYAFALVTAFATAMDWAGPSGDSLDAAKQLRYLSVPQMGWAALFLIVLWMSSISKRRRILFPALSIFLTLACVVAFVKLDRWFSAATAGSFVMEQRAASGIMSGDINRELVVHYIYPDFNAVIDGLARLRADRLSIYYSGGPRRGSEAVGH